MKVPPSLVQIHGQAAIFCKFVFAGLRHWLRVTFDYDHQHRRIRKRAWKWNPAGETYYLSTSHRFFYDDWNLIGQIDEVIGDRMSFLWGADLSGSLRGAGGVGGLVAVVVHSGVQPGSYFSNYDHNGNVVGLIDSQTGSESARYEYGPFGEEVRATGILAKENPFRFSTKFTDCESGFVYYGYRLYSPIMGRWLNRDPIGELGGLTVFGFVHNYPLGYIDSDGRFVLSLTMLVIDAGSAISHGLKGDYRAMARDLAFTVLDGVALAADLGSGGLGGTAIQGARLAMTAVALRNSAGLIASAAHLIPDTVNSSSSGDFCERDPHPLDPDSSLYPHPEGKKEFPGLDLDHLYSQSGFPNLRKSSANLDIKPAVENRGPKARWEKELLEWERLARELGMTESQIRQVTQSEWDSIARTVHPTTHPNFDGIVPK